MAMLLSPDPGALDQATGWRPRRHESGRSGPGLRRAHEIHADAGSARPGRLGYPVQPVLLGPAAHDDEVARPGAEGERRPAAPRLDEEPPGRAERQHRHDALRAPAGEVIAMPAGAVTPVPVQVQPDAVVFHPV